MYRDLERGKDSYVYAYGGAIILQLCGLSQVKILVCYIHFILLGWDFTLEVRMENLIRKIKEIKSLVDRMQDIKVKEEENYKFIQQEKYDAQKDAAKMFPDLGLERFYFDQIKSRVEDLLQGSRAELSKLRGD